MGRPAKYKTDEARNEARKRSKREYYQRHKERERRLSKDRYHARIERARSVRATRSKKLEAGVAHDSVLPNTAAAVGYPFLKKEYNLDAFLGALTSDLDRWTENKDEDEVWEDLVTRLIALQGKPRLSRGILFELAWKSQLAEQVAEQAKIGKHDAWLSHQRRQQASFERLFHRATRIHEGLRELVSYYHEPAPALEDLYEQEALVWQCT